MFGTTSWAVEKLFAQERRTVKLFFEESEKGMK
jgi:hypothetical protein